MFGAHCAGVGWGGGHARGLQESFLRMVSVVLTKETGEGHVPSEAPPTPEVRLVQTPRLVDNGALTPPGDRLKRRWRWWHWPVGWWCKCSRRARCCASRLWPASPRPCMVRAHSHHVL
jgi:hypothetical protein